MPIERPGKFRKIYPYLSQRIQANKWRIFESIPSIFLALGALYGLLVWSTNGYIKITDLFGISIYTLYPASAIIFGIFGALICVKEKYKGLLAIMSAAAFFDLIGILSAGERPDTFLSITYLAIIGLTFFSNQKSVFRFIWSAPFMFYLLVAVSGFPWFYHIYDPYHEPFEELVWCGCFYLAFYGRPKKKITERHEIEIADITYHP